MSAIPRRSRVEPILVAGWVLAVLRAGLRVAWLARRVPVLELAPRLREGKALPVALRDPERLAAVAERLLGMLPPWSFGRCLKRSLVLLEVWSRCGVEASLHLGMRREPAGEWEGHAWLSTDGAPPADPRYTEMVVV